MQQDHFYGLLKIQSWTDYSGGKTMIWLYRRREFRSSVRPSVFPALGSRNSSRKRVCPIPISLPEMRHGTTYWARYISGNLELRDSFRASATSRHTYKLSTNGVVGHRGTKRDHKQWLPRVAGNQGWSRTPEAFCIHGSY